MWKQVFCICIHKVAHRRNSWLHSGQMYGFVWLWMRLWAEKLQDDGNMRLQVLHLNCRSTGKSEHRKWSFISLVCGTIPHSLHSKEPNTNIKWNIYHNSNNEKSVISWGIILNYVKFVKVRNNGTQIQRISPVTAIWMIKLVNTHENGLQISHITK